MYAPATIGKIRRRSFLAIGLVLFLGCSSSAKADQILVVDNSTEALATATCSCTFSGFSGASVAGFTFSDSSLGNVPQFGNAVLEFGWTRGNGGTFNGGSPNNGIAPGDVGVGGTPTPEPATMLLVGSGLMGLAALIRRRRRLTKE